MSGLSSYTSKLATENAKMKEKENIQSKLDVYNKNLINSAIRLYVKLIKSNAFNNMSQETFIDISDRLIKIIRGKYIEFPQFKNDISVIMNSNETDNVETIELVQLDLGLKFE